MWHAGDRLDHVVERLQVLDVHRRHDVDTRFEEGLDVLPALDVLAAGDVGVRQFIDQRHFRRPGQHRVQVELGEFPAAVGHGAPGDDLQVAETVGSVRTAMGLDERDDHVGTTIGAPVAFVEHGVGLANTRGGTEIHAQLAPCAHEFLGSVSAVGFPDCSGYFALTGYAASRARFRRRTLTFGSPMKPRSRPAVYLRTSLATFATVVLRVLATTAS